MIMRQLMIYVNTIITAIYTITIISSLFKGDFKSAWIAILPLTYGILNIVGLLEV